MKQTAEIAETLVVMVNYVVAENAQPYKRISTIAELAETLVKLENYVVAENAQPYKRMSPIAELAETLVELATYVVLVFVLKNAVVAQVLLVLEAKHVAKQLC